MTSWNANVGTRPELDRSSPVPLYAQLDRILRARIRSGQWPVDMMVPSENVLAKDLGISRMTARGVLNSLAEDGLVRRVPGKGTFVAAGKIETPAPSFRGIRAQLEAQGLSTTTRLVSLGVVHPNEEVAARLHLGVTDEVFLVERLRCVQDTPISFHQSWIPRALARRLDQMDVITEQLCHILADHFQLFPRHINQTLESTSATREVARLLELPTSAPLLLLQEETLDEANMPFEYSRVFFRGDRIRLSFHFSAED